MRLSIIIPCYNMESYLPPCLDSLLDQGLVEDEFEVIVVNDGSADRTLAIAREYACKHTPITVIDKANAGVGAARNSGLDQAKGNYVYFLDPDDYLASGKLNQLLSVAEDHKLDILSFRSLTVAKNSYIRHSSDQEPQVPTPVTDGITAIADRKFANEIWWFLIRREFMQAHNHRFIEGRWMEDAILTGQLFCTAQRIAHIDLDVHRYRILPTSAMRNKAPEHYRKIIFDNANAAHAFDELIKNIPLEHPRALECINRLKTRQQSFVFFLLVRLMKSDLPVQKIPEMLSDFKSIGAYPLNNFLGKDYHGFSYSFLVYIFNHKILINPFIRIFRIFNSMLR